MSLLQAIVLGLVEGLTEYLPVSSTGHLLVAQAMLGIPASPAANAFAVCIQFGAILAVIAEYPHRVRDVVLGAVGRSVAGRRLLAQLLVAFAPAAAIGVVFDDWIEAVLFGPWPVVFAWFLGGVFILLFESKISRGDRPLDALTTRQALAVGLMQCLAMWPGTSRSLVTIVGGLLVGLRPTAAVEFSFLLGLVTLTAASTYKLLSSYELLMASYGIFEMLVGAVAAGLAAWFSVRWMVGWVSRRGLQVFGWWRVIAAGLTAIWLLTTSFPFE